MTVDSRIMTIDYSSKLSIKDTGFGIVCMLSFIAYCEFVHGSLFLYLTRLGEMLTRPAIADKSLT